MSAKIPRIRRIAYLHRGEVLGEYGYMAPALAFLQELQAQGEFQLDIHLRPNPRERGIKIGPDVDTLRKGRYDGIVSGAIDVDIYFHDLEKLGVPTVALDHLPLNPRIDAVTFDNVRAGEQAARILVERGHLEFLFVSHFKFDLATQKGGDPIIEDPVSIERKSGMQTELFKHPGANVWPTLPHVSAPHAYRHLRRDLTADLFRMMESFGNPPDAILTHGVDIAAQITAALKDLGLSSPKDVSIITFATDAPETPQLSTFACTQMQFGCREMGAAGWELLRDRITGLAPASAGRRHKTVPPTYKDYGSVRDRR